MSDIPILQPDLEDSMEGLSRRIFATLNCVQVGEIYSYDIETQTAEVRVLMKRALPTGKNVSYPLLLDCPVVMLQGGGAYFEMPIQEGDQCLIFFNDRDIDNWWKSGGERKPNTNRKHDLSDGFVLVGINAEPNALPLEGDAVSLNAAGYKVRVKNDMETLFTLMSDLIDEVKAIITTGSPASQAVSAASQAALEAIKTRMANLLEE